MNRERILKFENKLRLVLKKYNNNNNNVTATSYFNKLIYDFSPIILEIQGIIKLFKQY